MDMLWMCGWMQLQFRFSAVCRLNLCQNSKPTCCLQVFEGNHSSPHSAQDGSFAAWTAVANHLSKPFVCRFSIFLHLSPSLSWLLNRFASFCHLCSLCSLRVCFLPGAIALEIFHSEKKSEVELLERSCPGDMERPVAQGWIYPWDVAWWSWCSSSEILYHCTLDMARLQDVYLEPQNVPK